MTKLISRGAALACAVLGICTAGPSAIHAQSGETHSLEQLFEERLASVVFVEFFIQMEIERQPFSAVGLVADDHGLIVLLAGVVPEWVKPEDLRDIRVHLPNTSGDGFRAEYLGPDLLNGWNYIRVEEQGRAGLRPITAYPTAVPLTGETLWGICMTNAELDYLPYFRSGRLAAAQMLPLMTGFLDHPAAAPGGPLFNTDGAFVGAAGNPMGEEREMWVRGEAFRVNIRNPDESHVFLFADPFLSELGKPPARPIGDPRPWLGIVGMRPIDRDTAEFLGLENQGALVISEVLEDSPAMAAGLQNRDIVVAVDGERLPRFRPSAIVSSFFERSILQHAVGDTVRLSVIRDGAAEPVEVAVTLVEGPETVRAAPRKYFESLGLTVRRLTLGDALQKRVPWKQTRGAVVTFVRPNSPPAVAGLQPGDWIQSIDGSPVDSFEAVETALAALQDDPARSEYVLLVYRDNDTSVLRVRRNN